MLINDFISNKSQQIDLCQNSIIAQVHEVILLHSLCYLEWILNFN